jgi:hypothetical protein
MSGGGKFSKALVILMFALVLIFIGIVTAANFAGIVIQDSVVIIFGAFFAVEGGALALIKSVKARKPQPPAKAPRKTGQSAPGRKRAGKEGGE